MQKNIKHYILRFASGYYNVLLINLVLLFIFRPASRDVLYLAVWKLLLAGVLISAIFNCNHPRWVKITAIILAIPAVCLSWRNLVQPQTYVFIINAICTLSFMTIITGSILHDVVLRARVTLETLRGVICAYFMVAFAFAYAYYLIEFIVPGSFKLVDDVSVFSYTVYLSQMLYFSFMTLLTIGYGDIVPLKSVGQTFSVLEGVIGQFYIAILVSRLVGVYSLYSNKQLIKTLEKDIHKSKLE